MFNLNQFQGTFLQTCKPPPPFQLPLIVPAIHVTAIFIILTRIFPFNFAVNEHSLVVVALLQAKAGTPFDFQVCAARMCWSVSHPTNCTAFCLNLFYLSTFTCFCFLVCNASIHPGFHWQGEQHQTLPAICNIIPRQTRTPLLIFFALSGASLQRLRSGKISVPCIATGGAAHSMLLTPSSFIFAFCSLQCSVCRRLWLLPNFRQRRTDQPSLEASKVLLVPRSALWMDWSAPYDLPWINVICFASVVVSTWRSLEDIALLGDGCTTSGNAATVIELLVTTSNPIDWFTRHWWSCIWL